MPQITKYIGYLFEQDNGKVVPGMQIYAIRTALYHVFGEYKVMGTKWIVYQVKDELGTANSYCHKKYFLEHPWDKITPNATDK